ncbi:MAG: DNA repair protein RecN [Cyclobacteriaceae bacterium]|nr:DNA repair protein RecN [Cyclobacteriaceae bacterium]
MLNRLTIQNYALIKELVMSPSRGLNIITGETGAGKSIMLGAVGLLLGNRADTKVLLDEGTKCIIEGIFTINEYNLKNLFEEEDLDYDKECVIRREITPSGKSRAFVNDTPVTLDVLKKLGQYLMDVHSQNETLQLGTSDFQLGLIDAFAGTQKQVEEFNNFYKSFKEKEKHFHKLVSEGNDLQKDADYNSFLLNELVKLNLEAGEQEHLEEELKVLENAEEIKQKLNEALTSLNDMEYGALDRLQLVKMNLKQLANYGTEFQKLDEHFERAFIELKELARDIENEEDSIEVDFARTEQVQQRLSSIYQLQKKHQVTTVESLIKIQKELEDKSFTAGNLEEAIAKARAEMQQSEDKALELAKKISINRIDASEPFCKAIELLLVSLGMPDATISVQTTSKALGPNGIDDFTILFSANKGLAPQTLKQVASGGEYSRLMFCIKYLLADKTALPTIVFDEIDTGISGEIALKMGDMMRKMAQNHQVIAISHLPQIAAKGETHYFVYKDNSSDRAMSNIRKLTSDQSTEAIAKMIGGDNPSESAYESARELMSL